MCNEKNPRNQDTSKEAESECSCAGFKEMFDRMRKACRDQIAPFDCWSMMKRMMDDQAEKSRTE